MYIYICIFFFLTRNTNSRPPDIPVQKAKERKRNSEEQCTESRQLAGE